MKAFTTLIVPPPGGADGHLLEVRVLHWDDCVFPNTGRCNCRWVRVDWKRLGKVVRPQANGAVTIDVAGTTKGMLS